MSQQWDQTVDVVVGGTGAAALAAAVTAADAGLSVLMLESSDKWGGNTALSGGGAWLPDNPLMRRDKAGDSREEALAYLEATVGDAGPAASPERREAFVDGVEGFVTTAERLGIQFARAAEYPDYYPELPGGKIGRAVEPVPFDVRRLGEWWETSRGQEGVPIPVKTDDFWLLQRAWSTPDGMVRGAQVVGRTALSLARRQKLVGMGAAYVAAFLDVALRQGTQLWLSAPVDALEIEDGRVVGVRTRRDGREVRVRATRGVVLGAGGFERNEEWREKYHGVSGADSSGAESNLGSAIAAAREIGAALELMDDAWWGASVPRAMGGKAAFLVSERSMPHSIIVDPTGARFANESESYVDLGHHMLERRGDTPGRFWMITDVRHGRKYLRAYAMDPRAMKQMRADGILHTAKTLDALATAIDVDPAQLRGTVERFNGFARTGMDHDFQRGHSAYDRYYGDPFNRPSPNLGTIEKGPFTAIEVVPGDLGTKGGVLTDTRGRVLREDGTVIEGLYAAGNCSASVMGRTYPGPGSTIGPAAVFGYLAAKDIAGNEPVASS